MVVSQASSQFKRFLENPSHDDIITILPLLRLLLKLVNKGIVLNDEEEVKELAGKIEEKAMEMETQAEKNSPDDAEDWNEIRHVSRDLCFDIDHSQRKRAGKDFVTLNTLMPSSTNINTNTKKYFNCTSLNELTKTFSNESSYTISGDTLSYTNNGGGWNSVALGPIITTVFIILLFLFRRPLLFMYSLLLMINFNREFIICFFFFCTFISVFHLCFFLELFLLVKSIAALNVDVYLLYSSFFLTCFCIYPYLISYRCNRCLKGSSSEFKLCWKFKWRRSLGWMYSFLYFPFSSVIFNLLFSRYTFSFLYSSLFSQDGQYYNKSTSKLTTNDKIDIGKVTIELDMRENIKTAHWFFNGKQTQGYCINLPPSVQFAVCT